MRTNHAIFAGIVLVLAQSMLGQVPKLLNYQGRVTVGGTNFSGIAQFKFSLVNTTGTTNYWSNDGSTSGQPGAAVPLFVTNGLYSVLLGDTNLIGMTVAIAPSMLTTSDVRLRVWFNDGSTGFQQLTPDQRIAAVGFALISASLDPASDVRGQRLNVGAYQVLNGLSSTIAGGFANMITNDYATIGGGLTNLAGGFGSVVGGGQWNEADGALSTVCGGYGNVASNTESVVVGGGLNEASGTNAFVGGGYGNLAKATEATVAGGEFNGAYGVVSTVGGGYDNVASGYAATIPGGYGNLASGAYSLAAGAGAVATNFGAFTWADASSTNVFSSANNNEFAVRCAGGVRFITRVTNNSVLGVLVAPGGNSWSATSDRHVKENVKQVSGRAILARLIATPVTEWNLVTQDPAIRHLGPMAQDFHAAFGLGEDDRHISGTDADGVAFAAIQGLHEILQEKDSRIAELEKRLRSLEQRLERLASRDGTSGRSATLEK